jgi:hypothetical protein
LEAIEGMGLPSVNRAVRSSLGCQDRDLKHRDTYGCYPSGETRGISRIYSSRSADEGKFNCGIRLRKNRRRGDMTNMIVS